MDESGFTLQFWHGVDVLTSPAGAIAVLCWLLLLFALVMNRKVKWWTLVALMWCSVVGFYVKDNAVTTLAFPLEQIREYGRPISGAFLLALLVPTFSVPRGWRMQLLSLAVFLLFLFEMFLATRITVAGVTDRGIASVFIYALMFIILSWGCAKWVQTWDDAHKFLRCLVTVGAINSIATCYQLVVNRSGAIVNLRLMGLSGNPQEMAMVIAVALPPAAYLLARASEPKLWRIFCGIVAGMQVMMLLWTGSRTGILVATVGVTAVFWSRLAKFVAVGVVMGLVAWLAIQLYSESTLTISDMFRRGDTRTYVWRVLWEGFLSNPLFGKMEGVYGMAESSYLSVASEMGLFGLVPLLAFLVATALGLRRLFHWRSALGKEKPLADMITGGILSLFVGAVFEPYLLGTLVLPIFALIIYFVLMAFVFDAIKVARHQAELAGLEPGVTGEDLFDQPRQPYEFQPV